MATSKNTSTLLIVLVLALSACSQSEPFLAVESQANAAVSPCGTDSGCKEEADYELEPLYVVAHAGHFDAINMAGVLLREFGTRAELVAFAQEHGLELVEGPPPIYCEAITAKGVRCTRKVNEAGLLCKQHSKMVAAGKSVKTVGTVEDK